MAGARPALPVLELLLLLAWLGGAVLVLGRWSVALLRLHRAYGQGQPASAQAEVALARLRRRLGIGSGIGLRLSSQVASACAFGWLRPRILLPAREMSPDTLEAVLAHELCHIRARDPFWLLIAAIACALYWFNPLAWLCARRHRHDIELACDDATASEAVDPARYAVALVQAARAASAFASPAAAAMDRHGLAGRVRRLLARRPAPPVGRASRLAVNALAVVVLGLLAVTQLVAARRVEGEGDLAMLGFHAPRHRANERVIFFDTPKGVTIAARDIGFMCDGIRCVATVPARERIRLTAEAVGSGIYAWSGCTPAGSACWVEPSPRPAIVTVRAGA
jgi:beta-lactamase regulating signal transducer with metallopeptidase domain